MKKSQAFAEIMALKGVQQVKKIVDILLSIDNLKQDTIDKLNRAQPYTEEGLVPLEDIWVDLTYQRKLRLQALINRLIESGGFDKDVAGHIDLAIRTDGKKFVWDGFHRAVMAGLSGLKTMPVSLYEHDKTLSITDQVKKEARMFKVRNANQSPMEPGEIFKAEVVFEDETALKILKLLKECELDVEGTNPEAKHSLGGFSILRKLWDKIDHRFFKDSSDIIRDSWDVKTVSVILWCGLAMLLRANEDDKTVQTVSVLELKKKLKKIVDDEEHNQKDFTQPRLHGQPCESTARNLLKMGLHECYNDNGKEVNSLLKFLGIDEKDFDEQV